MADMTSQHFFGKRGVELKLARGGGELIGSCVRENISPL